MNRFVNLVRVSLPVLPSKSTLVNIFRGVRVQYLSSTVVSLKPKEMDELKTNPFYSRYADKLKNLQQTAPEEFESKLKALEEEKARLKSFSSNEESSSKLNQSEETLDSILNLEAVNAMSAEEIAELWKTYYSKKDCTFAIIPVNEFKDIQQKVKHFPNFIYPVPRAEGYEFFVQRWVDDSFHFTPLANYQKLGENAPTCLTLKHFTEFMDDKGIVLMKGQPDSKILSVYESQLLALQVKMYYGHQSGLKFNFVRIFNNSPSTFRHMDLIVEFENYKKDLIEKKEFGTPV